jgi:hypothetical protein
VENPPRLTPLTPAIFMVKFVWRMGGQAPGFSNPQAKCQIQTEKALTFSQMIGISKYFNKLLQHSSVRGAR